MATDIDVPTGLAHLLRPGEAEATAAKLDRPALLAAYALDRRMGYQDMVGMTNEANALKSMLAQRKMQNDRGKDLLHFLTQTQVTDRLQNPADLINQMVKPDGITVPDAVPGYPESVIANKKKGPGGNTVVQMQERSYIKYRNPTNGEEVVLAPGQENLPEYKGWQPITYKERDTRKGLPPPPDKANIPKPGAAAAPPTAPTQPKIVRTEKLPDGRTRGYDAEGNKFILK